MIHVKLETDLCAGALESDDGRRHSGGCGGRVVRRKTGEEDKTRQRTRRGFYTSCGGERLNGKIWGGPGKDGAHMTASESGRGEHLIGWERGLYKLKDLISMTMSCHRIRDMFLPHQSCCYHNTSTVRITTRGW